MNLTSMNKAFVPLVVMGFAYLSTKFGINFGIGDQEALVILGLVTSWLTYLIPNKEKPVLEVPVEVVPLTVDTKDVKIELQEQIPNILRQVTK